MTDAGPAPLPLTLLTGFLGSGKTTVLNTLLRHPDFARTAVIINEFGDVGLDHELVVATTETMVLLQSGCLCCALRGDLLETLLELAERRRAAELEFDRVVIETSGLADPAPILHTLLTSLDLAAQFSVDGVVVTVDAVTGLHSLATSEEARRQVALADLVLLTKTDLTGAEDGTLRQRIATLNAATPVELALHGRVEPKRLLGLGHFDPAMKSQAAQDWLRQEGVPRPFDMQGDPRGHLDGIRTIAWVIDDPVSAPTFDLWMDLLMARRGPDILRFKGLIHLQGLPHPFVVHGVQHIFHPPVLLQDWQGGDRRSKLVMIVRDFTDAELHDLFAALDTASHTAHLLPAGYLSGGAA